MSKACPICDVNDYGLTPLAAFALGAHLGDAFGGVLGLEKKMCATHAEDWFSAVALTDAISCTVDGEPAVMFPGDEELS